MISRLDDYCVHQAPGYLRVPGTTDRNFYDRYFFSGYSTDGTLIFGAAFGRYPNRYVQDAHFTVACAGTQDSLHASQRLGADPGEARVGPLAVEVVEPMRVLRCHAGPNSQGLSYDLTFRAETGAIDEGRLQVAREGLTYIDQTRFMQYGSWEGWIECDGRRVAVDPASTHGLRDKSWGVRVIGEQQVTPQKGGQIFWMNVVMHLGTEYSVIRTLDRADGSSHERAGYFAPLYGSPALVPVGEQALRPVAGWDFQLQFAPGTRRITAGRYRIRWPDGSEQTVRGRALGTLWYAGLGYNHDRWHHGLDHGADLVVERESWPTDGVDLSRPDRQFLASVMEFTDEEGRVIGFGHTEQLLIGEYRPLGWDAPQPQA
ncbi:MAG: hypothetical protein JSS29_01655 [Proteobacteria bacterium]|nr:hypothetical protein [Pseudomonadota bacterium]